MTNRAITMLCAVLLGLCTAAWAIDVPLTYEAQDERAREFRPSGFGNIEVSTNKPAGDWKLPELKGQSLFGVTKLGDEERLVVVAKDRENDKFFNRLYFDGNGNRDLTDDPALKGEGQSSGPDFQYVRFPAVDTKVKVGGATLPYRLRLSVQGGRQSNSGGMAGFDYLNAYYNAMCSYAGTFESDGQQYRVMLGDQNGNGRFGDKIARQDVRTDDAIGRTYWSGDTVFVSAAPDKVDYYDEQLLGDLLLLKDKLYKAELAPDYSKLTLTPVEGTLPALQLGPNFEHMQLMCNDKASVMLYRPGEQIHLPAGKYRIVSYELVRKTDAGDVWRLNAAGTERCASVELPEGSSAKLACGEPFRPTVNAQRRGRPNSAELSFNVIGAANEVISDLSRISGNSSAVAMSTGPRNMRPKEPAFRIVTADGEVVHSGRFEYG